jgi:hypothetical protein
MRECPRARVVCRCADMRVQPDCLQIPCKNSNRRAGGRRRKPAVTRRVICPMGAGCARLAPGFTRPPTGLRVSAGQSFPPCRTVPARRRRSAPRLVGQSFRCRANSSSHLSSGAMLEANELCPPCRTVSGKVVPVGTIAYRPLDTPPAGTSEHGVAGPHYNLYRANQAPRNSPQPCKCFWQRVGAVPASQLPPGAIPIEPFTD